MSLAGYAAAGKNEFISDFLGQVHGEDVRGLSGLEGNDPGARARGLRAPVASQADV